MKVGIFIADSNGAFPVPASKGGAVATLVEHLVKRNNTENRLEMEVVTFYDRRAYEISKKYDNIHFIWIRRPIIIKVLDELLFRVIRKFFKHKKSMSFKSLFSLIWYVIISSMYINKRKYDKVVLENNIPMAWIILLSRYSGDYFYHFHNVPRINAKCRTVFQKCTGFLCVSQYVADQIKSEKNPIGPVRDEQLRILYKCIDTEVFSTKNTEYARKEIRNKYCIEQDKKIVLFVGRLTEEKGVDVLLRATAQLKRDDFVVLVVGSYIQGFKEVDLYEGYLRELAEEQQGKVKFIGYVQQEEVALIYKAADVAVLPSMWEEPAGLTMIEAMSCGVPVITTESGGIPEYVGDRSIVLKKDEKLISNIANNIEMLLEGRSNCSIEGAALRVTKMFSEDSYLDKFCNLVL